MTGGLKTLEIQIQAVKINPITGRANDSNSAVKAFLRQEHG
jgi:hypothetical protein